MSSECELIVATRQGRLAGHDIIAELVDRRLFKTLSLLLARSGGVRIPDTLLILGGAAAAAREVWGAWPRPLMIRVDFTKRPERKVLGGIRISSADRLTEVCDWLLANGYFPLVHPFLDRFRNLYSVGVMMPPGRGTLHVEAVGPGFDAGDLRLGTSNPHETFDIVYREVENLSVIPHERYLQERRRRSESVARLQSYTSHVNAGGDLLANLDRLPAEGTVEASRGIPEQYTPMPDDVRRELLVASARVRANVAPSLPKSDAMVASFSYIEGHGWLLWDVYGHWYVR